jgi:Flp pilus assembly protein CpaB
MTTSPGRRRRRAAAFAVLALAAAAAAALAVAGYGARVARTYGPLRPVVVAARPLAVGEAIDAARAGTALAVRRIPVRFIPSGALRRPSDALGLAPRSTVPAGSYVLAGQLGPPAAGRRRQRSRDGDLDGTPVQIAVNGADALLLADPTPEGTRVDVVVTTEPTGVGPGRTYVAAAGVTLEALGPAPDGPGPTGSATATLALDRDQALRLISAESFAREVRLLPRSGASPRPVPPRRPAGHDRRARRTRSTRGRCPPRCAG